MVDTVWSALCYRRRYARKWLACVALAVLINGCGDVVVSSATPPPTTPTGGQAAAPERRPTAPPESTPTTVPVSANTIKIGIVTSLSGANGGIGEEVVRGARYAVSEINAAGGVLGQTFEIVSADTESRAEIAVRQAEKMAKQDGVKFFTGAVTNQESLALSEAMPGWDALYVSSVSKATRLTGNDCSPNTFRVLPNEDIDAATVAYAAATRSDLKTWYILASDYEWGHSAARAFVRATRALSFKIVGELYPPLALKDYSYYLGRIKAANPDGLWLGVTGNDAIVLMKQAKQQGLLDIVKAAGGPQLLPDLTLRTAGDVASGFESLVGYKYSLDNPINQRFVAGFKAAYGLPPTDKEAFSYTAVRLIFEGIKKVSSTNTDRVGVAMGGIQLDTPMQSKLQMRGFDHQALVPNFYGRAIKDPSAPAGVGFQILTKVDPDKITLQVGQSGCKGLQ